MPEDHMHLQLPEAPITRHGPQDKVKIIRQVTISQESSINRPTTTVIPVQEHRVAILSIRQLLKAAIQVRPIASQGVHPRCDKHIAPVQLTPADRVLHQEEVHQVIVQARVQVQVQAIAPLPEVPQVLHIQVEAVQVVEDTQAAVRVAEVVAQVEAQVTADNSNIGTFRLNSKQLKIPKS